MSVAPTPARPVRGGLGRTLSLVFLALALVPALVSGFVLYQRASETLEQSSLRQVEFLADLKRIDVSNWVEQRSRSLAVLAHDTDLIDALAPGSENAPMASTWLQERVAEDPAFVSLLVVNQMDGIIWSASQVRASRIGQTFPGWRSLSPEGVSSARYEPGLASDRLTLLFAVPIQLSQAAADNASGGSGWVLVGESSISVLSDLVAGPTDVGGGMRAYLLTEEGDPLIGVNGSAPAPMVGELVRSIASRGDGSGRFAGGPTGQTSIGAYRWLGDDLGLALIVEQQYFDVVAPLSSAAAWATLALVPALAIIGLIGLWLIRRQLAPLQTLSEAAQRLASGQWSATVPVVARDEIGNVSTAFNRMAGDLRRQFGLLESQAAARSQMLTAAEAVMEAAGAPQRLDVLLARTANALQEQLDVDAVLVFLRDDRDGKLHLRAGTEGLASLLRAHGLAYSIEPNSTVGWVATEQAPRLIPDVREDHVFTPLPEAPDMRSALGLPLAQGSDVVGVLLLLARQVGVFTSADLPVYQMIAAHLTVSIANSRQYERTQRTRMVEDVVVALAEQVSQTTDPERILAIGARVLGLALDARRATIRLGGETTAPIVNTERIASRSNGGPAALPPGSVGVAASEAEVNQPTIDDPGDVAGEATPSTDAVAPSPIDEEGAGPAMTDIPGSPVEAS